ncbi:MAG: ATP-binding protein [Syntrophobacteraceae bacterium]
MSSKQEGTAEAKGESMQMDHTLRMLDERTLEVNLPNIIGYERIAMDCSASFARIIGFTKDRIEDLKTAVSEACLNAMEHGNKGRTDARVMLMMTFDDNSFNITISDEGEGIVELPEDPDIEKKIEQLQTPRGLGIFLIKKLVDHVEFNKDEGQGHVLRMVLRMTY